MKLKKILSAVVVGALSLSMLVGCGTHADTKDLLIKVKSQNKKIR